MYLRSPQLTYFRGFCLRKAVAIVTFNPLLSCMDLTPCFFIIIFNPLLLLIHIINPFNLLLLLIHYTPGYYDYTSSLVIFVTSNPLFSLLHLIPCYSCYIQFHCYSYSYSYNPLLFLLHLIPGYFYYI